MALDLDRERLIRCSDRTSKDQGLAEWSPARRELYLLRLDVVRPLSVDRLVWPQARAGALRCRIALTVVDAPEVHYCHPDWEFPYKWPAEPSAFLGYDVADAGQLSGLMNCGYDTDVTELRERWARHLNQHHLFSDCSRAPQFRRITAERVPEHAPFYVYGIYQLPR